MQFLTAIKYFEIQIFMLFLLAIADLIYTRSNNRSSIGMIGCFLLYFPEYLQQALASRLIKISVEIKCSGLSSSPAFSLH